MITLLFLGDFALLEKLNGRNKYNFFIFIYKCTEGWKFEWGINNNSIDLENYRPKDIHSFQIHGLKRRLAMN